MKRILSAILVCVLMLGCVLTLVSCGGPNKDPKKAKEALEKAEYTVMLIEGDAAGEGIEAMLTAVSKDGKDQIAIVYYEKKADAKEAYKEAKDALKELGDKAPENYVVGKSGKVVWTGTKDAVKAAK